MQVLTLTLPESSGKVQRILRRGPQECTNSRGRLQPVNPSAARTLVFSALVSASQRLCGELFSSPLLLPHATSLQMRQNSSCNGGNDLLIRLFLGISVSAWAFSAAPLIGFTRHARSLLTDDCF